MCINVGIKCNAPLKRTGMVRTTRYSPQLYFTARDSAIVCRAKTLHNSAASFLLAAGISLAKHKKPLFNLKIPHDYDQLDLKIPVCTARQCAIVSVSIS